MYRTYAIRRAVDMVREFMDFGAVVDVVDPYASPLAVEQEYGIELKEQPGKDYDAIARCCCSSRFISCSMRPACYFTI